MSENATSASGGASNIALAALSDTALDRKIGKKNHMINSALADRARAADMIEKCEKSAVLSAWRLGQFLIEKKARLTHGAWLPWLDMSGISSSSAANCMLLARQISSAGNLGPSIRATLRALPEPTTATPKSAPTTAVKIDSPATATPKSVAVKVDSPEPVWPTSSDSVAMIAGLEKELYDEREKNETLEERIALMTETADPKAQKTVDTINNQRELIKTLKAGVAEWQGKASAARKEILALKRKIKGLEQEIAVA